MTRLALLLATLATACAAGGGRTGGCSALDGAQSALAFVIILATVLRVLSLREPEA